MAEQRHGGTSSWKSVSPFKLRCHRMLSQYGVSLLKPHTLHPVTFFIHQGHSSHSSPNRHQLGTKYPNIQDSCRDSSFKSPECSFWVLLACLFGLVVVFSLNNYFYISVKVKYCVNWNRHMTIHNFLNLCSFVSFRLSFIFLLAMTQLQLCNPGTVFHSSSMFLLLEFHF